ncbi:MAG: uracil-DNA glycosylase [Anaerolineae bacterium]|jgi:DNA polymerase|nr:uracil-DNA glycosylase [Anaerolineae bacterium]
MHREETLNALHAQIRACTACPLHRGRTNAVPGDGPADALIMFVGEAPGFHEDQQGVPFVGAAGRLLNELLEKSGIARRQVFITNVIKCRPPGNRDPEVDEVTACKHFLDSQIEIIAPKVIVTLGRHSMARAFPETKISQIHGQPRSAAGQIYFPMYHPAAALHQPSLRSVIDADFGLLRALLDDKLAAETYTPPPEAEQLSLF